MSSSSESSVSWKKVAFFGLAVSVPIVGYVVWKRMRYKPTDAKEVKDDAKEKNEKKNKETFSESEVTKPDIILSAEAEGHCVDQVAESVPVTTQSNDGTESNEYVISLNLEDNDTRQDETVELPEVEGEFFLTLDLSHDADISNEATLELKADNNDNENADAVVSNTELETLSSYDKMSMSELPALQLSGDVEMGADDGKDVGVEGYDKEEQGKDDSLFLTERSKDCGLPEKYLQPDQGSDAEKECSDMGISPVSGMAKDFEVDPTLSLSEEISEKIELAISQDHLAVKESERTESLTAESEEEHEPDVAVKPTREEQLDYGESASPVGSSAQMKHVVYEQRDTAESVVKAETIQSRSEDIISKLGSHSDSSDIEEIEDKAAAESSYVQEGGAPTTSPVVDDENDIVVIKYEDKLKTEVSAPSDPKEEEVSPPIPEDTSPLYLSHPYTRDLVPLGCSLKTVLHTEQHIGRRGLSQKVDGGAVYARHYITDVKSKGLAHTSALRNGQELCYISKIPTCGMSHDLVVVMVGGIHLTDSTPLLLTIRTEYKDELGVKHEQCDTAVISFSVTPTGFCMKNIQTEPYRGRRIIDTFWNDTRPFSEERCWIQHMKSQLFLKGSGRQLTLSALKNPNPLYMFVREAVRGRHLPPTPSCSTFWKEPQVMLAFPGDTEKGKKVQQFVSCMGPDSVGFLPLRQTEVATVALNDKDPRLFYFISRGSHCFFVSVMMTDHFLAVGEGLQSLCLRYIPEHRELNRQADVKFTVKYPPTTQE